MAALVLDGGGANRIASAVRRVEAMAPPPPGQPHYAPAGEVNHQWVQITGPRPNPDGTAADPPAGLTPGTDAYNNFYAALFAYWPGVVQQWDTSARQWTGSGKVWVGGGDNNPVSSIRVPPQASAGPHLYSREQGSARAGPAPPAGGWTAANPDPSPPRPLFVPLGSSCVQVVSDVSCVNGALVVTYLFLSGAFAASTSPCVG